MPPRRPAWRLTVRGRSPGSVREERRCQHRLPGDRQRDDRPRAHPGVVLEHRPPLGGAGLRAVPASPGVVLPTDRGRSARDGALRSGPAVSSDGGAGGRHPQRAGRRGLAVGGVLRVLPGRADRDAVRRHPSRANASPCPLRHLCDERPGGGLPVGAKHRVARQLRPADRTGVGHRVLPAADRAVAGR